MSVDTHKAIKALMGVGFDEAQAETLIETVGETRDAVATKADVEALGQKTTAQFQALREETTAQIQALREETTAQIQALREETKANLQALEQRTDAKLRELELRMTIRLGTMMFAVAGLIIAVLKLFP